MTDNIVYYTMQDVAKHNLPEDCWVSLHHKVLDLSTLITENRGRLTQPIIRHAGEDISHWIDEKTGNIRTYIDSVRNIEVPFLPHGPILHVPPPDPTTEWNTTNLIEWWNDPKYVIGRLTKRGRWIEIVNVLTKQRHSIEVPSEDTIEAIQTRYLQYNAHANSYTWKFLDQDEFIPLNMKKTLEENGIVDETPLFEKLDIETQFYKPIIHLYYNDDLTVK